MLSGPWSRQCLHRDSSSECLQIGPPSPLLQGRRTGWGPRGRVLPKAPYDWLRGKTSHRDPQRCPRAFKSSPHIQVTMAWPSGKPAKLFRPQFHICSIASDTLLPVIREPAIQIHTKRPALGRAHRGAPPALTPGATLRWRSPWALRSTGTHPGY